MRIQLPSGTPAELVTVQEPSRGLVVIPDIMGLRPLFVDHAERIAAEQGWNVCCAELFPGQEHLPIEERMQAVGSLDQQAGLADIVAAADATGCETVAVTGFCMGGMYTYRAATTGRFARAVAFYGQIRLPEAWRGPTQQEPLEMLAAGPFCPLLAVVGTADPYTPAADVADLAAAGVQIASYEGADHGFVHDPLRPAHRADDAADAWDKALAFLGQ